MAYDQSFVNTVYEQERRRDPNLTNDQFIAAAGGYGVDKSQIYKASDAFDNKLAGIRTQISGMTGDEVMDSARRADLSPGEVGLVFNTSGDRVTERTGYDGTGAWDSSKTKDWNYDESKGGWFQKLASTNQAPQMDVSASDIKGPSYWNVTGDQTVAGQLEKLLKQGSPLLEMARTKALQAENMNGRLNTTMAAQSADAAVYDKALDIATPDAATYARSGEYNATADNTFSRDANAFTREGLMANFNVKANDWAAAQKFDRDMALLGADEQNQIEAEARAFGFQSARDAALHGYNLAEIDRRGQYGNSNAASTEPSYFDKLTAQENATTTRDARNRLYGARADFTSAMLNITSSNMGEEQKRDAIRSAQTNYNAIIVGAAGELGWDANSWVIKGDFAAPATTATTSSGGNDSSNPGATPVVEQA